MAAQELPNIIGRKSKHPLLEYLFINIFFPPLAYFLLWKHHAPLKPLAKFTLINSFFFICYFVPALFSFVVAMSALDHKNILHNPSLLSQTILFTGIGVFVTFSGITSSEIARKKSLRKKTEKESFLAVLYCVLVLQYIIGTSLLFYMGHTAGTLKPHFWFLGK
jgi:uncharacterized membrane protein YsdA (DUF1294 family)